MSVWWLKFWGGIALGLGIMLGLALWAIAVISCAMIWPFGWEMFAAGFGPMFLAILIFCGLDAAEDGGLSRPYRPQVVSRETIVK